MMLKLNRDRLFVAEFPLVLSFAKGRVIFFFFFLSGAVILEQEIIQNIK